MALYTLSLTIDDLLKPAIEKIKGQLRDDLEKQALAIVTEEVAKFAIDLSRYVSVKDFGQEIVITVRKEIIQK